MGTVLLKTVLLNLQCSSKNQGAIMPFLALAYVLS